MTTEFKGRYYQTVIVSLSDETFIVGRKAEIHGGGTVPDDPDTLIGYGIVEDPDISGIGGNTYRISGRVAGMASGIATVGDDTRIILGKGAEVTSAMAVGSGLGSPGSGYQSAIIASGEGSRVSVARGAEVQGMLGIILGGSGSAATNAGVIQADLIGMSAGNFYDSMTGLSDMRLTNNGRIEAYVGMMVAGVDGVVLANGAKGEIIAPTIGMMLLTGDGMHATVRNAGTIRVLLHPADGSSVLGASAAIAAGGGDEKIINTGRIIGDILLADGDDAVNNSTGTIKGDVLGGDGDDTLIVSRAGDILVEVTNEGLDTIRSSVSYTLSDNVEYLILTGTKNVDATGNATTNVLLGNAGDNVLRGLGGIDVFAFRTGGGRDTIADFGDGADVINLSRWKGIDDFGDVQAHAKDVGSDMRIRLQGDVLVIAGHHLGDLDATDFSWLA